MNQSERRNFLIQSLLEESREYRGMQIPSDSTGQRQLLRGLMNVRMVKKQCRISEHSGCVSAGGDGKKGRDECRRPYAGAAGAVSLAGRYHRAPVRCDCECGEQRDDRLLRAESPVH